MQKLRCPVARGQKGILGDCPQKKTKKAPLGNWENRYARAGWATGCSNPIEKVCSGFRQQMRLLSPILPSWIEGSKVGRSREGSNGDTGGDLPDTDLPTTARSLSTREVGKHEVSVWGTYGGGRSTFIRQDQCMKSSQAKPPIGGNLKNVHFLSGLAQQNPALLFTSLPALAKHNPTMLFIPPCHGPSPTSFQRN